MQTAIAASLSAPVRQEPRTARSHARSALLRLFCRCAAVLFLAAALFPRSALAQQGAGVLIGNVVDASNKEPVGDAVVTVTSPGLQGEQMVVTDATGLYRIPALPPGVYVVRIEKEQFRPFAREGISLRADTTIRLNAELLPEALKAEEVTVQARPPTVDVGSSSTGMSLSQDFTRRIPLARPGAKGAGNRSFESIAEAAPGAAEDRFGVSVNGTTSPENQYVLDGTSVNNPAYGVVGAPLSVEFTKEVNVITGGYMPEYGRATGATMNVDTKSGSNDFHGGVFAFYSPGALEGRRKPVIRDGQAVLTTQDLSYIGDIGGDIGGPILKDKLWFYAGFDYSRTRYNLQRSLNRLRFDAVDPTTGLPLPGSAPIVDPVTGFTVADEIPGTRQSFVAEGQQIQALGKLTLAVNPDNHLTLTVIGTPSTAGGGNKYAIDPNTGLPELDPRLTTGLNGTFGALAHKLDSSAIDTSLKWSSAFDNKRILIDTTLGWHHQTSATLPADESEPGARTGLAGVPRIVWRRTPNLHNIADFESVPGGYCDPVANADPTRPAWNPCPVTTYNSGGPDFLRRSTLDRYQGRSVLTVLLQGAGHHVVKAGIDVELDRYDNLKAYSGTFRLREATSGANFAYQRGFGFLTGPDQAVVLDKIHNVTKSVTAGAFAQDSWSVMDKVTLNVGVRYDAQFLYSSRGGTPFSLPNQWSPRIGAIYDPTQEGRAKVSAAFARFYEGVPLDIADRSLSRENSISGTQRTGTAAAPCAMPLPGLPPTTQGPCLDEPRQAGNPVADPNQRYTAGGAGSVPIDPNIKPQSSDEIVLVGEYEIIRDGRVGLSYTKRWMNYVIEDMSRDEAATYFLGNPGYGIAKDFPKAVRNYDGVTLYFSKQFADEWQASASYTISYLRGNYPGLYRPETGQLDPNINSDFDLITLMANRTGPLPGDQTHSIKLFGSKDWRIATQHGATSGIALRARSGAPTSYLGSHPRYGVDEAFIVPRGDGERLPWNFTADLQLGYRFDIDKDKTVVATLDVFNLFNFQGVNATDQRYTNTDVLPVLGGTVKPDGTIDNIKHPDGTDFLPSEKNPNFGHTTGYQPPRIFRFGLRTTF